MYDFGKLGMAQFDWLTVMSMHLKSIRVGETMYLGLSRAVGRQCLGSMS